MRTRITELFNIERYLVQESETHFVMGEETPCFESGNFHARYDSVWAL